MKETSHCPVCHQIAPLKSGSYPFCSYRCQSIDLGNWLGENYRIPLETLDEKSAQTQTTEDEEDED